MCSQSHPTGETIAIGNAKLGGTGETVDPDGSLSDVIGIDLMQQLAAKGITDAQLPEGQIEFTLTVRGHFSGCEATQAVTWPLSSVSVVPRLRPLPGQAPGSTHRRY